MTISADEASSSHRRPERTGLFAAGALIGGVLASSCCILPLAFVMLGISGAWIGGLTALAPYQPLFFAVAFASLARGFWLVYRRPLAACSADACGSALSRRGVKTALWTGLAVVVAAAATNLLAPIIL